MKPRMMSKPAMDHLFYHILDGHTSSYKGIVNLEQQGLVTDEEITDLLKKNHERLIDRIKEFKLVHKLLCLVFIFIFGYMQINGEDLEMRRGRKGGRSRRRNESENVITL